MTNILLCINKDILKKYIFFNTYEYPLIIFVILYLYTFKRKRLPQMGPTYSESTRRDKSTDI